MPQTAYFDPDSGQRTRSSCLHRPVLAAKFNQRSASVCYLHRLKLSQGKSALVATHFGSCMAGFALCEANSCFFAHLDMRRFYLHFNYQTYR